MGSWENRPFEDLIARELFCSFRDTCPTRRLLPAMMRSILPTTLIALAGLACGGVGPETPVLAEDLEVPDTATSAHAIRTDWLGVELRTGNDDKRSDTQVKVWLTTRYGYELLMGSYFGERLADRTTRMNWNRLPALQGSGQSNIETDDILGCWIHVDLGAGGGLQSGDQWQMDGLRVLAWNGRMSVPILDLSSFSKKFTRDGWTRCPPIPAALNGTFSGTVGGTASGDSGRSPVTLRFSDLGGGRASVNWSIRPGATFGCYGSRAVTNVNDVTTGTRIATHADGSSTWRFPMRVVAMGYNADLTAETVLSADGRRLVGDVEIQGPFDCDRTGSDRWTLSANR